MTLLEKVELLVKRMRWKVHLFKTTTDDNPIRYITHLKLEKPHHNIKTL